MHVIPAIDILEGGVVRLAQGDFGRVTRYGSVGETAAAWMEAGAGLLHVVDLDGARGGVGSTAALRAIADLDVAFQVGGGIRDAASARRTIEAGATRVVIGSAIVSDPDAARTIVGEVGAERVVAALDVADGRARGAGWLDAGIELDEAVARVSDIGVRRALVTGIARDGMMSGPDVALLERVRGLDADLGIIASGGVGSLDDLRSLARSDARIEGAIVGRALYEGAFTLADAIEAADEPR